MTDRQPPDTTPPHPEPGAHDALEHLLGSLHRHGFLRFANEVVTANARLADTFVDVLDKPGMQSGMQNLAMLVTALSRIPPEQFGRAAFAAADALHHVGAWQPAQHGVIVLFVQNLAVLVEITRKISDLRIMRIREDASFRCEIWRFSRLRREFRRFRPVRRQ
ncbi:hypothetical protein [Burkholderia cenocepacia]|uniref:hypothetical protein n=3 Tax=Burkholderia cenocepacia TaxID=95486 RepID=UPI000AFA4844|nr:hypothetical protein [Burkholderia cenocepacia]